MKCIDKKNPWFPSCISDLFVTPTIIIKYCILYSFKNTYFMFSRQTTDSDLAFYKEHCNEKHLKTLLSM
jgi:hypothetical protein